MRTRSPLYFIVLVAFLLAAMLVPVILASCSPSDPLTDAFYAKTVYTWNGTAWNQVQGGAVVVVEVDPVFTTSPAFGITAANILTWNGHPVLTTGVHGVGAGDVVGTTLLQELTGPKTLTSAIGKGTWTASGVWKLPAMYFNGDITTDRWLSTEGNTFLGERVVGNGGLTHTGGAEGYYNTIIGHHAANYLSKGSFNTGLGQHALFFLTDGNSNVGVGALTGEKITNGSYNVAIGNLAGPTSDSSYGLFIDNRETDDPLIGGNFTERKISINGSLHVVSESFDMSQIAVEPNPIANKAGIYAWDLSADNTTIGFFTETPVETALGLASEKRIPIRWNNATYYLLAEVSSFGAPVVGTSEPTVEQGARVGLLFFNSAENTWKKCTGVDPVTWETLSSGGATTWGSISGNITSQTDLQGVLDGKEAAGAVTAHEETYVHSNIHQHANATILDSIQEALTTALKSSYDWLVTNITAAWKTTVDNHVSSPHAPSNAQKNSDITKAEIEAKLTGEISSHTHAGGGGDGEVAVVTTQDTPNATVNLANATGMAFNAQANSTYIIEGFVLWNTSATTVGIKLSATASGSPTITSGHFIADAASGTPDSSSYNANDIVVTTSASAFTTNNLGKLNAILKTSGSTSTWQLRFAAETTGTITIKSGSVLRYRKVA